MVISMAVLGLLCALIAGGLFAQKRKAPMTPVLMGVLIGAGVMAAFFVVVVCIALAFSNM